MKTCTKCKTKQPLERFSKNKQSLDGLQHTCKACCQAYRQRLKLKSFKDRKDTAHPLTIPKGKGRTCVNQLASADDLILHVGRRITEEREDRGLSMRALARMAGCSVHSIRNAELFISAPHIATLASIAIALDLGFHDLLGDPEDHKAAHVDRLIKEGPPKPVGPKSFDVGHGPRYKGA